MTAASTNISRSGSNGAGSLVAVVVVGVLAAVIGLAVTARPVDAPATVGAAGAPAVTVSAADRSESYVQGIRAASGQSLAGQGRTYHTALLEKHPPRAQARTYHTTLLERHPARVANPLSAWDPYRGK